jgi:hypothetical protein
MTASNKRFPPGVPIEPRRVSQRVSFEDIERVYRDNRKEFKKEYGDVYRTAYLTGIATWLVVVFLASKGCWEDTCGPSLVMTTGAFFFVMVSLGLAHWVSKRSFPVNNAWVDIVPQVEGMSPYNMSFYRLWLRQKGYITLEEARRFMVSERRHQKQVRKEEVWRPAKPA